MDKLVVKTVLLIYLQMIFERKKIRLYNFNKNNKSEGFSLIEVMVVLVLLIILTQTAVPNLNSVFQSNLEISATKIASLIEHMRFQAILTGKKHYVEFNTEKNTFDYGELIDTVNIGDSDATKDSNAFNLDKVFFREFQINGSNIENGAITLDPSGYSDIFKIVLESETGSIKLEVTNVIEKVRISLM